MRRRVLTFARLALRLHSGGALACALLGALFGLLNAAAYPQVAGVTPEERLLFARQIEPLAAQMTYMLPLPVTLDTLGGYVQWRAFGLMPLVFGFWALFAATGAARGDEERGLLEQWLSTGLSRISYLAGRFAGFVASVVAAVAVTCLATWAGTLAAEPLSAAGIALQGLALVAVTIACFGIALFFAELVSTRRAATGLGGAVLLALFLLNSLSRTDASLSTARWLSPFFYYDRTQALLPGATFDAPATLGVFAAGVVFAALAAAAFTVRDLGGALLASRPRAARPVVTPAGGPLLRTPALFTLYDQRLGLLAWLCGITLLATFFVSMSRTIVEAIQGTPRLALYLEAMSRAGANLHETFLGFGWFGSLQLLVAIFAVTQVARWAAEDADGRLEMTLSAPIPRWRIVWERALALAAGCALLAAPGALGAGLAARAQDLAIGEAGLLASGLMLVPLGLAFGAIGAAIVGRLPRLAVPALATFAVAGYFIIQFGPLLEWPDWVMNLSLFQLYGSPLAAGISRSGLAALLAIAVTGFGLATWTLHTRDVGR